ncbi:sigma-54-dependent transcriptional regulator [Effusibacillus dendaii]|uniref:Sigma-54-dependent Fis family transcriptional regulator n=1 Tax=Effusibacillus dendaii TaxID=2743772 RepID=A0A7I8DDJ8_9BACL|nr:sigma-54 dependent transcriptional regulator [Effusibacillus dendaii]BCJ88268.1 sigma-54-dependent Fis family transcriptional regulator [Effusibacillus dendaii]
MEWQNIRLLIVDDETDLLDLLLQRLQRKGCTVSGAASSEEALRLLDAASFDVGIYDINLPGVDGIQLLRETKHKNPDMEVIMLTGHGTVDTAIEAMKLGAYDYLRKPYSLPELEAVLAKAAEKNRLRETNRGLKQVLLSETGQFAIVGQSPAMQNLLDLTRRVADSGILILIEGESGTGKELIAKALHFWSGRREHPFIAVNSAAIPESLLESELFGHVKGAFTGAVSDKQGLVELADRGTLFLDEIGEMPLAFQAKLLRFLESQEFRRVGDSRLRRVDVRVVVATNRILETEVAKGNFREDLFYRLNVMKLTLPPLCERMEDIPLLIDHFLAKSRKGQNVAISADARKALCRYRFPGNVRELFHMLERGMVLAKGGVIETRDLLIPEESIGKSSLVDTDQLISLPELEKQHILRVLNACKGNKTQAAKILDISVRNLYRKLEEYGMLNVTF